MHSYVILTLVVVASAAPMPNPEPRLMDLSEAEKMHTAICPIVVEWDVEEGRVPERIKTVKCAQSSSSMEVNARHSHLQHCDALSKKVHQWRCTQLTDWVVVYNKSNSTVSKKPVSVGCTCMLWELHPGRATDALRE